MEQRWIVLLGKTGSGKSAAGNTIHQGNYFQVKSSPESVTKECYMAEVRHIRVVDTPGMFDTTLTEDQIKTNMNQCLRMSGLGTHAFLLVIRLGRFTEEEKNAVKWIQEHFGEDASLYTIVLFTHADQLGGRTLEEFLQESTELRRLINTCGNRYHALNNNDPSPDQVNTLMQKIDNMVNMNQGNYYTNEMYERARKSNILEILTVAAMVTAASSVGITAIASGIDIAANTGADIASTAAAGIASTAAAGIASTAAATARIAAPAAAGIATPAAASIAATAAAAAHIATPAAASIAATAAAAAHIATPAAVRTVANVVTRVAASASAAGIAFLMLF